MRQFFISDQVLKSIVKTGATSVRLPQGSVLLVGGLSYTLNSDLDLDLTVSGVGGLDTGAIAPDTEYYVYVVNNSGTIDLIASASPTQPTGFSAFTRVGKIQTDSGNDTTVVGTDLINEIQESQIETLNVNMSQAQTDISNLQNENSSQATDISNLQSGVLSLEGRATTLESDVLTIQGEQTTQNGNISTNTNDISNLQTNVSNLQSSVSTNTTDILNNAGAISTNQLNIATNVSDIASLDGRVSQNETDIANLQASSGGGGMIIDSKVNITITTGNTWTVPAGKYAEIAITSDGEFRVDLSGNILAPNQSTVYNFSVGPGAVVLSAAGTTYIRGVLFANS